MMLLFDITLPFQSPVLVFSLVLLIILIAPALLRRVKIPGIIGLIFAGIIIGPNGLNLLAQNSAVDLLGTIGLLYIMFLAALEIDLVDFKKNRKHSIVFGALIFSITLVIGLFVSFYLFHFEPKTSFLLSIMYSTFTLVSYPIAYRLGITRTRAVTTAIGGLIITDTTVLIGLSIITNTSHPGQDISYWLVLISSMAIFIFAVLYGIAKLSRWFFKNLESEGSSQYLFVLAVVFITSLLAELAGLEPIIGAFLAGLALNRQVPHSSALMNRVTFIGNTLFIPFFLISVGMLLDLRVFFMGPETLIIAVTMLVVSLGGKFIASFLTQKIFKYSVIERNLIFGLSASKASATLAIVLVGYKLNLLDYAVFNGTIILILVSCIISTFLTQIYGKKLAVIEGEKMPDITVLPQRIMVPISNPATVENLIDFSILIKEPKCTEPIYLLTVVLDDELVKEKLIANNKVLDQAIHQASANDQQIRIISRVDFNIANGIARAVKDLMVSDIVIGWSSKITTTHLLFGTVLNNLLRRTDQMIVVTRLIYPLNSINRVVVVAPPNAELELGFARWLRTIVNLCHQTNSKLHIFGTNNCFDKIRTHSLLAKTFIAVKYSVFEDWANIASVSEAMSPDALLAVVNARPKTISYNHSLDNIPKQISKHFEHFNFIILYPEQNSVIQTSFTDTMDGVDIRENIERIYRLRKSVRNVLKERKDDM